MLELTVENFDHVFDAGSVVYRNPHKITFNLPEPFVSARGTCGCTASKIDNEQLEVVYIPNTGERNTVARKTIKLTRADGSQELLQFNVTVK